MEINTVLHGDCLELMHGIPDGSIDMILCDLPYGSISISCEWDIVIPFEPLWEQYKRIIKQNGAIVLTASQPFTSALIMSNLDMFGYELIWDKKKGSNPLLSNRMPMKSHENIIVFYKDQPTYNPQFTIGKPYKAQKTAGTSSSNILVSYQKDTFQQKDNDGKRHPLSVMEHSMHCGSKIHPTQKPVELFEKLIMTYTNEGNLVLDNTAGSGTTAIACLNTKRNYILMEKEEKYFNMINDRIKEWKNTPRTMGASDNFFEFE